MASPPDPGVRGAIDPTADTVIFREPILRGARIDAASPGGRPVFPARVVAFLEEIGFQTVERSPRRVLLTMADVEVFAATEGDELTELELTFTLGRDAPRRREAWGELVCALCAAFSL